MSRICLQQSQAPFSASIWRDPTAQTPHYGVYSSCRRGCSTRRRHRGKPWATFLLQSTDELFCCGGLGKLMSLISGCLCFVCAWRNAECEFKFIRICIPIQEWLFLFILKSTTGRWHVPYNKIPVSLQMFTVVKLNTFKSPGANFYVAKQWFPRTQKEWKPIPSKICSKPFLQHGQM